MSDPSQTAALPVDPTIPQIGDGPMKRLYRWTLSLAERPSAPWALGLIAFAESSFFPIPPDIILIPMSLARPKRAWLYAAICTVGSVLGALLGYAIGALLFDTIGQWLIHLYGYDTKMAAATAFFQKWGALAILVKGLTPIPFKLVTIVSGIFKFNLPLFVLLCAITRGARFFILAVLMNRFGEPIKRLLERYFGVFVLVLVVLFFGGFYIAAKVL
jgi:membrane protein YqaA with SNARE-associated domain